jgi:hypothetical protein
MFIMTIEITFNRAAGGARSPGFDGFGGDWFAPGTDAFFDVMRDMVDAGMADDDCRVTDERGMACFTFRSLHAGARRYRPTAADRAAREGRKKVVV